MIHQAIVLLLFVLAAASAQAASAPHPAHPSHPVAPLHSAAPQPSPTPAAPAPPPFVRSRQYEYEAPRVEQIWSDTVCWSSEGSCNTGCENGIFDYEVDAKDFCKSTTTAQMSFVGVGADGTQLTTEISALNSRFVKILSSARPELRVRTSWQLDSCDGVKIEDPSPTSNIQEVIRQLSIYDFSQYMSCKFSALSTAASEAAYGLYTYKTYLMSLTILDNDAVQFDADVPVYFARKTPANAAAEAAATQAAAALVDVVKNYGALLVNLHDAPTPDRKASLLAYLAQNKQTLINSIQTIDKNLPLCGTMTKLNINFSIKRGYAYVHTLEATVLGSYPFGDVIGG